METCACPANCADKLPLGCLGTLHPTEEEAAFDGVACAFCGALSWPWERVPYKRGGRVCWEYPKCCKHGLLQDVCPLAPAPPLLAELLSGFVCEAASVSLRTDDAFEDLGGVTGQQSLHT